MCPTAVERGHRSGRDGGDLDRHFPLLLMAAQDVVDPTEMSEHSDGGLALFAEGFDNAVIPDAVRLIGLYGSH